MSSNDKETVKYLVKFLRGGQAYAKMEDILANLPENIRGAKTDNSPYSIWELVEHLRIAQWDILDFSRNPDYQEIKWPDAYWPNHSVPEEGEWDKSMKGLFSDLEEFIALLEAPDVDLYTPFPWGEGQNLIREAMLIANHNSHHGGQILLLRRELGAWK